MAEEQRTGKVVAEGSAEILPPAKQGSQKGSQDVFYNPAQVLLSSARGDRRRVCLVRRREGFVEAFWTLVLQLANKSLYYCGSFPQVGLRVLPPVYIMRVFLARLRTS